MTVTYERAPPLPSVASPSSTSATQQSHDSYITVTYERAPPLPFRLLAIVDVLVVELGPHQRGGTLVVEKGLGFRV